MNKISLNFIILEFTFLNAFSQTDSGLDTVRVEPLFEGEVGTQTFVGYTAEF